MELIRALYHLVIAVIAVLVYRYPARNLTVVAVTGTSGKTTTAHLIYWILKKAGKKVSLISSVEANIAGKSYDTGFHVTTPTPFSLQRFLRKSADNGDKFVVIEASSHGIAQKRMIGTNIRVAVLTNIAHEHLDYHKTFNAYAMAKLSIIVNAKVAVVNKDDLSYKLINKIKTGSSVFLTYSLTDKEADFTTQLFSIKSKNLPGDFNQENILAAAGSATIFGVKQKTIIEAVKSFKGINGRFEQIPNKRGFTIIVDFAHKPNALEAFLKTVREMTDKRVIIMFGSAGERDLGKRAMMGAIAEKYADLSVLTAEDPRSENVNDIIEQIMSGVPKNKKDKFIKIPDRAEAIDTIINKIAQKGDIIGFLGKSHEKSMCYGAKELPWSEHEQISKALERK